MKFGLAKLSIIPLRAEAREQSEMVNQILFGETFTILQEKKKWYRVQLTHDGYEGWIDRLLCTEIAEDDFAIAQKDTKTSCNLVSTIVYNAIHLQLVRGSSFNALTAKLFPEKEIENLETITQKDRVSIIETALLYLDTPYLWGGRTPFGIDCSGFSQIIYKIHGIAIPRDASQQVSLGISRNFVNEAQPGDLAFFDNEDGKVIHVGIVLKNQKIIHASGKVRIDTLDHQGIFNEETQTYSHKLRVIQNIIDQV